MAGECIVQDGFLRIAVETMSLQGFTNLEIQSYLKTEEYDVSTEDIEAFLLQPHNAIVSREYAGGDPFNIIMAETFLPLSHASKEVVLTVHFNTPGTRLVTGSADHRLRVFDEKGNDWTLVEEWRGHNAEITEARWHPHPYPAVIGSIGEDTKCKIWLEDTTAAPLSGRRFNCVYSQSPSFPSPYTALAFHATSPTQAFLALATRDGRLSLHAPEKGATGLQYLSEWREIDQIFICGVSIPRGSETSFRFSFQDTERPIWAAIRSGLDPRAMSLAVTAMNDVKVFRITPQAGQSEEQYHFSPPVAELTGPSAIVRDVAWSPILYRDRDMIATASADGYVRIYEIEVPKTQSIDADANDEETAHINPMSGISAGLAGADTSANDFEQGGIPHTWVEVAELKHEGCWRVQWMQDGNMLISTGDTGRAHIWAYEKDQGWAEFADFGPEDQ